MNQQLHRKITASHPWAMNRLQVHEDVDPFHPWGHHKWLYLFPNAIQMVPFSAVAVIGKP